MTRKITARPTLTPERLRELLHYDPETGIFTWRVSRHPAVKGEVAGTHVTRGRMVYLCVRIDGVQYYAHRLAWLYVHGAWPPAEQTDHASAEGTSNALTNLRPAAVFDNQANALKRRDNTSGFKGVYWHPNKRRWIARISVRGRRLQLGAFHTAADAGSAYAAAAVKHFGLFARV